MTNENSKYGTYGRLAEDLLALTAGVGAGVGLMYFCDPHRGRERRNRLAGEAAHLLRRDESKLEKHGKDLLNRVAGFAAKTVSAVMPEEEVSDEALLERVRSKVGHALSHPREIRIDAAEGVITLRGKLTHAEKRLLTEVVRSVPGVKGVKDRITRPPVFAPGLLMGLAAGLAMFAKGGSSPPRPTEPNHAN
jgi:hypothetical protein